MNVSQDFLRLYSRQNHNNRLIKKNLRVMGTKIFDFLNYFAEGPLRL